VVVRCHVGKDSIEMSRGIALLALKIRTLPDFLRPISRNVCAMKGNSVPFCPTYHPSPLLANCRTAVQVCLLKQCTKTNTLLPGSIEFKEIHVCRSWYARKEVTRIPTMTERAHHALQIPVPLMKAHPRSRSVFATMAGKLAAVVTVAFKRFSRKFSCPSLTRLTHLSDCGK
jgi:hypothetical protein